MKAAFKNINSNEIKQKVYKQEMPEYEQEHISNNSYMFIF